MVGSQLKGSKETAALFLQGNNIRVGRMGGRFSNRILSNTVQIGGDAGDIIVHDLDGKAVDLIMGVTPVSFRYNEDPAQEHYGLIAQDVKMVMDRLKIAKDAFGGYVDGETLGLRYDEFIAPLILTVQRQQEEIDELNRLIKEGK